MRDERERERESQNNRAREKFLRDLEKLQMRSWMLEPGGTQWCPLPGAWAELG
jgi:hypothetical protein